MIAGGGAYVQETEKIALAESTGLDQKQINNWFINQRKRHWKPAPEDMPFSVMDGGVGVGVSFLPAPQGPALYMDRAPFMVDGMYRLGSCGLSPFLHRTGTAGRCRRRGT